MSAPTAEDALKAVEALAELLYESQLLRMSPGSAVLIERVQSLKTACGLLRAGARGSIVVQDILARKLPETGDCVHILWAGRTLCGYPGIPKDWPEGQTYTPPSHRELATCSECRDLVGKMERVTYTAQPPSQKSSPGAAAPIGGKASPESVVYHLMSSGSSLCGKLGEQETWGPGHAVLHSWDSVELNCPDCLKKLGAVAKAIVHLVRGGAVLCGKRFTAGSYEPGHAYVEGVQLDEVTCGFCIAMEEKRKFGAGAAAPPGSSPVEEGVVHLRVGGWAACGATSGHHTAFFSMVDCPACKKSRAGAAAPSGASPDPAAVVHYNTEALSLAQASALCGATSGHHNTLERYVTCAPCKELLRGRTSAAPPASADQIQAAIDKLPHAGGTVSLPPAGSSSESLLVHLIVEEGPQRGLCGEVAGYQTVVRARTTCPACIKVAYFVHLRRQGRAVCGETTGVHTFDSTPVTCPTCLQWLAEQKSRGGAAAPPAGSPQEPVVHMLRQEKVLCGLKGPFPWFHSFVEDDFEAVTCGHCICEIASQNLRAGAPASHQGFTTISLRAIDTLYAAVTCDAPGEKGVVVICSMDNLEERPREVMVGPNPQIIIGPSYDLLALAAKGIWPDRDIVDSE